MKIALFIPDFTGGGAERVFANLAKEFVSRGHGVDLVVCDAQGTAYLEELPGQARVVDLRVPRMRQALGALARYLRAEKPDVLMATLAHSCCLAVMAKFAAGSKTKIIIREANTISADLGKYVWRKKAALGLFIRVLYPLSSAIIGVSMGVVEDLHKRLPGAQGKIHLVYSPIITDDMQAKAQQAIVHPWFGDASTPVILTVGRLTGQKKFGDLIDAFAALRRRVNARLLIVGEGELRKDLEEQVARLGLNGDVQLPGFDANPFKYMSRSKLFVLSSGWEGLPGALIQAMACGCPVISTDCPSGPSEILQGGRLGKLVPVGDVQAMAAAMEETLKTGGARIQSQDLDRFTAANATEEYLKIFEASHA